jgi:hypothetical protein
MKVGKVGDLVHARGGPQRDRLNLCLIVDTVIQTSGSYAGCKKYVVMSASGDKSLRWLGELKVVNESR